MNRTLKLLLLLAVLALLAAGLASAQAVNDDNDEMEDGSASGEETTTVAPTPTVPPNCNAIQLCSSCRNVDGGVQCAACIAGYELSAPNTCTATNGADAVGAWMAFTALATTVVALTL